MTPEDQRGERLPDEIIFAVSGQVQKSLKTDSNYRNQLVFCSFHSDKPLVRLIRLLKREKAGDPKTQSKKILLLQNA